MFNKATRKGNHIKLAITGPSGAGKTFSALRLARGLTPNGKIAVIDTENNSSSLYASDFDFEVASVEAPFEISKLVNLTKYVLNGDYEVLIVDSASHFWDGVLEYKNSLDKRGGNSFANWNTANEHYKLMLRAILFSKIHVIVCMRSKMEYVLQENEKGKHVPQKVGMAPIMRDGVEYEFSCVLDLSMSHEAQASKDRTQLFKDKIFQITEQTGQQIKQWLEGQNDAHSNQVRKAVPEMNGI
ncbi:MAG: AAA family ATPase [Balneolaceae bacterium]|nr:AAA family ATPase [Balneolaceae bacterium]